MKNILQKTLIASMVLLTPITAFAQREDTIIKFVNPIKSKSVAEVMNNFFKILIEIGAVAVTLAIVYAGFLFVVARGNPEQLNKAKTTLFWTIIGALVLLGAQIIAGVIANSIKSL